MCFIFADMVSRMKLGACGASPGDITCRVYWIFLRGLTKLLPVCTCTAHDAWHQAH